MTLNEAKRKRLIVPDWIGVFNVLGVVEIYGDQGSVAFVELDVQRNKSGSGETEAVTAQGVSHDRRK